MANANKLELASNSHKYQCNHAHISSGRHFCIWFSIYHPFSFLWLYMRRQRFFLVIFLNSLFICLFFCLSVLLSIVMSVLLTVRLHVCLFFYISVFLFFLSSLLSVCQWRKTFALNWKIEFFKKNNFFKTIKKQFYNWEIKKV